MNDEPHRLFERHYTREEANALLPKLEPMLHGLREARDRLTDAEAHEALDEATPTNGGGKPGTRVGEGFREVRRLLGILQEAGVVVRDVDRGLIDFPSLSEDGHEVYLCWALGEDSVEYWHEFESGFGGREPLD